LALRVAGFLFNGMGDLDEMVLSWGAHVHDVGLGATEIRNYGLLSYVFHGWAFELALVVPRFWWVAQKFFEVAFEIGAFWALTRLVTPTQRWTVMYLYWLNPWFVLHGGWQGFWDGPHTLLALVAVLTFRAVNREALGWGLMGGLLAVGALFKPQGLFYCLVPLSIYLSWQVLVRRQAAALIWFALSALAVFGSAAGLLALNGGDPLQVPRSYMIQRVMPNLCNGCVGIWRPASDALMLWLGQSGPTWNLQLPRPLWRWLDPTILAGTISLVTIFALRVSLANRLPDVPSALGRPVAILKRISSALSPAGITGPIAPYVSAYLVLVFGSLAIPQLATRVHMNHTYSGLVLLIPLAIIRWPVFLAWLAMVTVHWYAHISILGLGRSTLSIGIPVENLPPSAAVLLNRIDTESYPLLLQFQEQANRLIGRFLPADPVVSLLSFGQFAALSFVLWELFVRMGQSGPVRVLDRLQSPRSSKEG
jgi:hypothetical protein